MSSNFKKLCIELSNALEQTNEVASGQWLDLLERAHVAILESTTQDRGNELLEIAFMMLGTIELSNIFIPEITDTIRKALTYKAYSLNHKTTNSYPYNINPNSDISL